MIDYDLARAALDQQLENYQADDVAWENTIYKPQEGIGYLRPFMLPAEPKQATVGTSGVDRVAGIYQIDVSEPKDDGLGPVYRKVDEVIAEFSRGLNLTNGAVTLTISRSWPGPAFSRDSFYVVPVSVSWYSYG